MDAGWEPYAVECDDCKDKRSCPHGECADKEDK